ncbi:hypothetical protein [Pseudomarimonas salicorniae]|uniref:Uncharacterized protein n=1 Tax=Pseudomarimonas salicorniae TaxID=2933270 RepID=A0ABT0GD15_9GAMM|nr:hypothetical protein [Lysobacter sp. CAU 1642]MCK7592426.1 hypothetical protein [Lysobacter sp. CAU 1642]
MPSSARLSVALTLALAASFAQAELRLSPSGTGGAVYVPYFTVENGQSSLLTVTNHSDAPASVGINFTEQQNGQAALYFMVFLPPKSAWTAAVVSSGESALMSTDSEVCTVPQIPPGGVRLRNFDYAQNFPDGGPTSLQRTRSGAIELIEGATLSGALAASTVGRDCNALTMRYLPGAGSRIADLSAPAQGISASVQVVNVEEGALYPVAGVAVRGYSDKPLDIDPSGPFPRFSRPVLPTASLEFVAHTPAGDRLAFAANRGPDAISSLFMQGSLGGEIQENATLNADTQWVLSFPTKHEYVARFQGTLASRVGAGQALPPFARAFAAGGSCETIAYGQTAFSGGLQPSPDTLDLCFEQTILEFEPNQSGLGSLRFDVGATREISARRLSDGQTVRLRGLPVIGQRLSRFVNGSAGGGTLANYTVALPLAGEPSRAE